MQYVPELTWLLFLRILDVREKHEAETAAVLGNTYTPSLAAPYRWSDWENKVTAVSSTVVQRREWSYRLQANELSQTTLFFNEFLENM